MKRALSFFILLLALAPALQAQFIKFGVKGGVNSSKVHCLPATWQTVQTSVGTMNLLVQQGEARLGLHIGLFNRLKIAGFWFQPELLFTQTKVEFILTQESGTASSIWVQKLNRIDIPCPATSTRQHLGTRQVWGSIFLNLPPSILSMREALANWEGE